MKQNPNLDPPFDWSEQNCLVIDLTYRCNALCPYCQWGSNKTKGRMDQPNADILIQAETMEALKTERIVFSGGEPLLRSDLESIVEYYAATRAISIVTITNGLLLTPNKLKALIESGLTGITFSLDALDQPTLWKTRRYTEIQRKKIFDNILNAIKTKNERGLELGINVVITKANLNNDSIPQLVDWCARHSIDWIKFAPVFDDGYVGMNAPELLLDGQDSLRLREIGQWIGNQDKVITNPPEFWSTLADTVEGKELDPTTCGLDTRQAIAIRGQIKFCFWIDYPTYGDSNTQISPADVTQIQESFSAEKAKCTTGMYCYCLQRMDHKWKLKHEND